MIIGKVGSGKSSLLSACINEMVCNSGTVRVRGKIAYIPQEAFLLNASIRENILFGNPFDKQKYEEVITICQMEQDLRA